MTTMKEQREYYEAIGKVYPAFMRSLTQARTAMSDESVNVAGGVNRTKKGWVGMVLYVMCPDHPTAGEMIPALAATLASHGFHHVAKNLIQQLDDAKKGVHPPDPDTDFWPAELGDPVRRGVRLG